MQTREQRHHRRLPITIEAQIEIDGIRYPCTLCDLSLRGAMLRPQSPLPDARQQQAQLTLTLDERRAIRMPGRIAHQEPTLIGLDVKTMDLESLGHLRRLLELHWGSAMLLERELAHMLADAQGPA